MKYRILALASLCLLGLAAPSFADSLEASMNNKAIQVEYERFLPRASNLVMNASYTYSKKNKYDNAHIGTLGLQGIETDNTNYRAAVGARLYFYDYGSYSGTAIAFGGLYYHAIPQARRFSLGGHLWHAPEVTSFGDTEKITEAGLRGAFRVINNTDVFLGYRIVKLKNEKKGNTIHKADLEKALHLGFRLNF